MTDMHEVVVGPDVRESHLHRVGLRGFGGFGRIHHLLETAWPATGKHAPHAAAMTATRRDMGAVGRQPIRRYVSLACHEQRRVSAMFQQPAKADRPKRMNT